MSVGDKKLLLLNILTSISLFVKWKCVSVGDKKLLLLNILTSFLCQFEACAIIWRQAVHNSFLYTYFCVPNLLVL